MTGVPAEPRTLDTAPPERKKSNHRWTQMNTDRCSSVFICLENTEWRNWVHLVAAKPTWHAACRMKDPFGVQALACPDQCSVKAELRTCARCIFMRFGCAPAHVRLWFHFVQSVQPEILVRLRRFW